MPRPTVYAPKAKWQEVAAIVRPLREQRWSSREAAQAASNASTTVWTDLEIAGQDKYDGKMAVVSLKRVSKALWGDDMALERFIRDGEPLPPPLPVPPDPEQRFSQLEAAVTALQKEMKALARLLPKGTSQGDGA